MSVGQPEVDLRSTSTPETAMFSTSVKKVSLDTNQILKEKTEKFTLLCMVFFFLPVENIYKPLFWSIYETKLTTYKVTQVSQIQMGKDIGTGQLRLTGGGQLESKRPEGSRRF